MDENGVRRLVRRVVYRTLGMPGQAGEPAARQVVTEADVRAMSAGAHLEVPPGALITPLAREVAMDRRITLGGVGTAAVQKISEPDPAKTKKVALGADHGGFPLKEQLKAFVGGLGYQVVDCGTHSEEPVDYPDFAFAVARLVAQKDAWRGIVVDGAGIGSCMAANKVPGVRAAMCYDQATAVNSREHNDANVLTLGAKLIGPNLAQQIVEIWLKTPVGAERHVRRVAKIMEIEQRFVRQRAG